MSGGAVYSITSVELSECSLYLSDMETGREWVYARSALVRLCWDGTTFEVSHLADRWGSDSFRVNAAWLSPASRVGAGDQVADTLEDVGRVVTAFVRGVAS